MLWSIYFLPDQPKEEKKPDAAESDDSVNISSLSEELKMRIQNRINNHRQREDLEDALSNDDA
jgi:hypothetical protein